MITNYLNQFNQLQSNRLWNEKRKIKPNDWNCWSEGKISKSFPLFFSGLVLIVQNVGKGEECNGQVRPSSTRLPPLNYTPVPHLFLLLHLFLPPRHMGHLLLRPLLQLRLGFFLFTFVKSASYKLFSEVVVQCLLIGYRKKQYWRSVQI